MSGAPAGRGVPVKLDRDRTLRYDFNSLCNLEAALGQTLEAVLARGTLGFREIRGLVWVGLLHEDPRLTLVGTGELLQAHLTGGGNVAELATAIHDGLLLSGLIRPDAAAKAGDASAPLASATSSPAPSAAPSPASASSPPPSSG